MSIFTLRFKSSKLSGIQFAQFEAENDARADAAARAWCNHEPGRQFIGIAPFLAGRAVELLGPMPDEQAAAAQPIEQAEQRRGPGRPPKVIGAPTV